MKRTPQDPPVFEFKEMLPSEFAVLSAALQATFGDWQPVVTSLVGADGGAWFGQIPPRIDGVEVPPGVTRGRWYPGWGVLLDGAVTLTRGIGSASGPTWMVRSVSELQDLWSTMNDTAPVSFPDRTSNYVHRLPLAVHTAVVRLAMWRACLALYGRPKNLPDHICP